MKFAGDALSILFTVGELEGEGQSASIEEAVARAMQCSLDIHARLHDYLAYSHEDPSRCVRLSLHMGLGCGQLTAVHLGGVFGESSKPTSTNRPPAPHILPSRVSDLTSRPPQKNTKNRMGHSSYGIPPGHLRTYK